MTNRLTICAGCNGNIRAKDATRTCIFSRSGFPHPFRARPCAVSYHETCIRVGHPCRSRLKGGAGLSFPLRFQFPSFICESCTVRAMLGRELNGSNEDRLLLCLERIRILDLANAWTTSTLDNYRPYLTRMYRFEARFGVQILVPTPLLSPPTSPCIALAWCQQQYAWKRPSGKHPTSGDFVSFTTIRKLRSAASTFFEWDIQQANPGRAIREHGSRRPLIAPDCSPTDTLQYALMSIGMGKRLGESNRPPTALQFAQVAGI